MLQSFQASSVALHNTVSLSHDDCQLIAALFEYVLLPLLVHQVQLPVQPLMIKIKV